MVFAQVTAVKEEEVHPIELIVIIIMATVEEVALQEIVVTVNVTVAIDVTDLVILKNKGGIQVVLFCQKCFFLSLHFLLLLSFPPKETNKQLIYIYI